MKKSLIALAAVAASGVAMAQSSVTLYGVADVGLGYYTHDNTDYTGALANEYLNNGTSRIGFRGVEDLGNGLKASFNFEQGVSLADGSSSGFQRAAWLALSGDFGSVRVGRGLTPSYDAVAAWEITGAANYSVTENLFGYGGHASRNNASLVYTTPSFSGFTAKLGYIFEDNYVDVDGDGSVEAKYDLALIYKNGPIAASASYNNSDDGDGNFTLGGAYDFGSFKVAASYHKGNFGNVPVAAADYEGFTVGASVPLGAFSLAADVGYRDDDSTGLDSLAYNVEAKYALSKRTFVYAVYAGAEEKAHRRTFDGKDGFGLGIRHNF